MSSLESSSESLAVNTHGQTNRRVARAEAQAFIDTLKPLQHPNSQKLYLQGSRADLRVGMRQILQTDTRIGGTVIAANVEKNPPIPVYDCAGPYSDLAAQINVRQGLAKLRLPWIIER